MYNTLIRFDGDIIITDPCYIIRKGENQFVDTLTFEEVEEPERSQYMSYRREEDYPDCIWIDIDDPRVDPFYRSLVIEQVRKVSETLKDLPNYDSLVKKFRMTRYSEQYNKELAAYNDAWGKYNANHFRDDWEYCCYGEVMERLGLSTFLCDSTIYGDWSCTTFDSDTKKEIGKFCADAGMVGVFLLNEVLKYNPDFDYHINRKWTTTLIKDFHGTVELHCDEDRNGDKEVTVVGKGNINFIGKQTGL